MRPHCASLRHIHLRRLQDGLGRVVLHECDDFQFFQIERAFVVGEAHGFGDFVEVARQRFFDVRQIDGDALRRIGFFESQPVDAAWEIADDVMVEALSVGAG